MIEYTIEEIETAYKKFKSYVYYDNTNLHMRKQIAEFENTDFTSRLETLHINLINLQTTNNFLNEMNPYFKKLISKMTYWKFPKKIHIKNETKDQLLRNYQHDKRLEVKDYIYHVNAPIELHIISVLWIMKEGQYLVEIQNLVMDTH